MIRYFQQKSEIPLLIGLDAEWGLAMRITDAICFPKAHMLGRCTNNKLIYDLAKEIGRQCKVLGVHINFAPVADISANSKSFIHARSFGPCKYTVAQKATAFMHGLQDAGILACAKHFPGHGGTIEDSHKMLPTVLHDKMHIYDNALWPFKQLINEGVTAVMVGHLLVPALDPSGVPTSFSSYIIKDLLRKELGFNGLIITDGLSMGAITNNYAPGELELKALLAGNDILLDPVDVPKAVDAIKQAIYMGLLTEQELDDHVIRILDIKHIIKAGKDFFTDDESKSLLHTHYAPALKKDLIKNI